MDTPRKNLWAIFFFALVLIRLRGGEGSGDIAKSQTKVNSLVSTEDKRNKTSNEVVVNNKRRNNGGGGAGGGGGGGGWGTGGGGGGGGGEGGSGGWGWGWGGGGGGYWRWGCKKPGKRGHHLHKNRVSDNGEYKMGEFAQCMAKGRCRGMRLDCPLHCGGLCFYDCRHMCKAHCRR